jgi:hypothetical protein
MGTMNDREKLIELIQAAVGGCTEYWLGLIEDHLIASGVTFATDNNDGGKWIPVTERLPEAFVFVLVHMPGEKPFPTVREGFISNNGVWHSAYFDREPDEVTHWMPMPEPPKE